MIGLRRLAAISAVLTSVVRGLDQVLRPCRPAVGITAGSGPEEGNVYNHCPPVSESETPQQHPTKSKAKKRQRAKKHRDSLEHQRGCVAKMARFAAYCRKVYDLASAAEKVMDGRKDPDFKAPLVFLALVMAAALRIRSLLQVEERLKQSGWQKLLGRRVRQGGAPLFGDDVLRSHLMTAELDTVRNALVGVVKKMIRNGCFRMGAVHALRLLAVDGVELFSSRKRCCEHCLSRKIKTKKGPVIEYYHKIVVAMLISDSLKVVVDFEPILPRDCGPKQLVPSANARDEQDGGDEIPDVVIGKARPDEGELTAAKRLLSRVKQTYPKLVDVVVADALYANGPLLTLTKKLGYEAVFCLRNPNHEPYKDAIYLADRVGPCKPFTQKGPKCKERVALWDIPDIETLDTYNGKLRVVLAQVEASSTTKGWKPSMSEHNQALATTFNARRLTARTLLKIKRLRWNEENSCFHQMKTYGNLDHAYVHEPNGWLAMLWVLFLGHNLLQAYYYRRLVTSPHRPKTILSLVDTLRSGADSMPKRIAWTANFIDTG